MITKNCEYIVEIIDNGFRGEGIAKIDGQVIFIPNTIKGEKVRIKILKVNKNESYAKVIEIINKSDYRREDDCETYNKCGGCALRHIDYHKTIEMKTNSVKSTLRKSLGRELEIDDVISMDNPYHYRNKLQYPVGKDSNGLPVMGVFQERSHRIIETRSCLIQDKLSQLIANDIISFIRENNIDVYDEEKLSGSIRHIIIRSGKKTNEVMVMLVSNTSKIKCENELVEFLVKKYKEIKTIVKNVNSKNTNVILGFDEELSVLYGDGIIYDYLDEFRFKISPFSFYQVNPVQCERLYSKAVEYANLTGNETVFDLYCGIGTIGIFASRNIKKLYGIETIADAILDAKENAKLNNVNNAEFFVGDVEDILPKMVKYENVLADVVFVDPPRKGCDKKVIETLFEVKPKTIVYVSCNPATLARDLKIFEEYYSIEKVAVCDMFPFTHHIESIVRLKIKENI